MDQTPQAPVESPAPATDTASNAAGPTPAPSAEKISESDVKARFKETYDRFVEKLSVELKQAGKVGKKQWEDALKSTREFITRARPELKREDIEKLVANVKTDVRKAMKSVKGRGEDLTRSPSFLTARDKGAEFLLKIATRLKDTFETMETNLEETLKARDAARNTVKPETATQV